MTQRSSGQAGQDGPGAPGGPDAAGAPAGSDGTAGPDSRDWPDDLWPRDDDQFGPGGPAGWPGPARRNRRVRPGVLVVIVVAAAAAGAGITAVAVRDLSSPSAIASGGTGPGGAGPGLGGNGAPAGQGAPGGGLPGGGPGAGPGRAGRLFLIGTVTAVSRTSIAIGGPGRTVTAAVTSATRVTGKASAITGIKVGDQVSAQITHGSTGNVAVAIADPPQLPAGASLP